jgi:superfamily II DNA or RNA helicase
MDEIKNSPWKNFSSDVLQKYIGSETLEQLIYYLPLLRSKNFNESDLYKKNNLAIIFNAFSGADYLEKKEFRKDFFSSLNDETLKKISSLFYSDEIKFDRATIIHKCASIKWEKNVETENLCRILNIDVGLLPDKKYILPKVISEFEAVYPFKSLKEFQSNVSFKAIDELKNLASRFVIQMPTGSGKTRVAMEILSQFVNENNQNVKILWLAHQKELCNQALQCFIEVWSHLKSKKINLYRLWDDGDKTILPEILPDNSFIVGNFQKLYSEIMNAPENYKSIANKLDLIIIDEAHKAIAPTYKKVIDTLSSTTTKVIGLTATPGRSITNDESNQSLSNFFHNKIISIPNKKEGVISYLRDKGILSRAIYDPIHIDQKITPSKKQLEYMEQFLELPPQLIKQLSNDKFRNFELLKKIDLQIKKNPNAKILFFGLSIQHSKFICSILNTLGIKASHVDGETSLNRRASILNSFKDGKLNVLCNERLMSTGFDAPKTDTIVIARPTFSIVLYSQIIGRGLRGPEIGGTKFCTIIDVKDNIQGFSDHDFVYEYFDEYFDNL